MGTTFITVDPFVDLLTANGTVGGVATVADSDKYIPGQAVTLRSGTQPDLECYVTQIISPTEIGLTVRTRPWLVFATQTDISAYLVADSAELETVLQVVETSLASDDHLLTRATERTLASIAGVVNPNLDVPLSTRASEATLLTRVADATITARLNTLGQKVSAASAPVVLASDQLPLPVAVSAGTDRTATGTITSTEDVEINTQASGACGVQVSGIWTGTLVFEATVDDVVWNSVNAEVPTTGDQVTSTTANGVWIIACAGFQKVRVRGDTVTSGTATVFLSASTCPQVVTLGAPLPTGSNDIGSVTANIGTSGALALEATLLTRATEATLLTRATEATLATKASEATVASILGQLDVPLSTRASEATLLSVETNTDNLNVALSTRATEATLATRASEATLALIKVKTDNLDVLLSTRASEATLATKASEATLALIKAKTDNLDVLLSSRAAASTQTDGTQKSIVRGGAKGATAAADVTSTAEGADHQGLDVQIYHGGVAKDPTQIRALTSADVVTAAQGTAAVTAGAWPVKITDGTNVAAVKAASTAPIAADPAAVVALSPNSYSQWSPILTSGPREQFDAFGRFRVSNPVTLFDSKQIFDNQPLYWDDQQTSGAGTSSTYNTNQASTTLAVSAATAGTRVRQTFRRFNYQSGKSQLIFMTGVLAAAAVGITRNIGYFDVNNGLFFQSNPTGVAVVRRTFVTGVAVDTVVQQTAWNIDKLDGTGASGITLDLTKEQIFAMDFEWLGGGSIRFGFVIAGRIVYVHSIASANVLATVWASTPNLPLRYEISNSGAGGAASLLQICATVISEGGSLSTGSTRAISRGATPLVTLNNANVYPLVSIRLGANFQAADVRAIALSVNCTSTDAYNWYLLLNPTLIGAALTFTAITNSAVEADAVSLNTTTVGIFGTILAAGTAQQQTEGGTQIVNPSDLQLGSNIAGTSDVLMLAVQRLIGAAETFYGTLSWRETV